ncbi:MAG: hypothetical protein QM718_06425 [Steroidobacteraceae bacterium]
MSQFIAKSRAHALRIAGCLGVAAGAAVFAPAVSAATGSCDRACLEKLVGDYAEALVKHDPAALPLAAGVKASENGVAVKLGEGASWKGITAFKSQPQYVSDVVGGEAGYLGVVEDAGKPAFLALRLKVRDGKITESESILVHDGEGGPAFEPEGFIYREAPYIRDVPAAVRGSREDLKRVANIYWDVSTSSHDASKVPYASDCWHFENGMNTNWERFFNKDEAGVLTRPEYQPQGDGRIWTCARETYLTTTAWKEARQRHFVIDEERGLIMTLANVDYPGRGMPAAPNAAAPAAGGPGGGQGAAGPGAARAPLRAIEGPGAMPIGMSPAGMRTAMAGGGYVIQHFMLMRIVDGKIAREQDVMRQLPTGAQRLFD